MSSRLSRYQESITRFIKTRSAYCDFVKSNNKIEELININEHEASIAMLTIFNIEYKKCKEKKTKPHIGYYMASGIDLLTTYIMVNDNLNYYEEKYGSDLIKQFLTKAPIYIFECLSQNTETLDNTKEKDRASKIQRKAHAFLNSKMLEIVETYELEGREKAHRTDIIKYRFNDTTLINNKYRKIKIIDKDKLVNYIDKTFGNLCKCAFVLGWMLGMGDDKMMQNFERLGTHLGVMLKLSMDFQNLERDINIAENKSTNFIVNYGIHECFGLFDDSKVKLLEGCITLGIYNITIKEIIDSVEKKFNTQLKNSDIELESRYTSFSTNGDQ